MLYIPVLLDFSPCPVMLANCLEQYSLRKKVFFGGPLPFVWERKQFVYFTDPVGPKCGGFLRIVFFKLFQVVL